MKLTRIFGPLLVTGLMASSAYADGWNLRINDSGRACGNVTIGDFRLRGCATDEGFNGRANATLGGGNISVPVRVQNKKRVTINGQPYLCRETRTGLEDCTPTR